MTEVDALLARLAELDEKQAAHVKAIESEQKRIILEEHLPLRETANAYRRACERLGQGFGDEICAELDELCPIYLDLPPEEQLKVREAFASHWYINWALADYVERAAERLESQADNIAYLQHALAAALIENNSLQKWRPLDKPLERLYVAAHEAGLDPDNHIKKALAVSAVESLQSLTYFPRSDRFKRLTTRKPGHDELLSELKTVFSENMYTLLTDLMDLSNKQDAQNKFYDAKLGQLLHDEKLDYANAKQLAEVYAGPDFRERIYEKLDVLCPAYLEMTPTQRGAVKRVVHSHRSLLYVTSWYIGHAAEQLERQATAPWLQYGLAAAAIEDGGTDYRDTFISLGSLYQTAYAAGIDPSPSFKKVGEQLGSSLLTTFTSTAYFQTDVKPNLKHKL